LQNREYDLSGDQNRVEDVMKKEDKEPRSLEAPAKKTYVRPEVTKHAAASVIVGSGCGSYVSQTSGGAYYY